MDPIQAIKDYVRHPSVSTDPAYAEGMRGARDFIAGLLDSIGLEVSIVDTPRHPAVIARRRGPESWPHVVIYGHYDVQPPDPLDLWESAPFEPEERDGQLYGRGTADNKGPTMAHIAAVARLLEAHPDLPLRLTFLIEGEEEIGSPSLPLILEREGESLRGDFVLLSDTQSPSHTRVGITTALRGIVCIEARLRGAASDMHSGLHGGAVLNPIQALSELCASLHNADGSVNVPGFYDAVAEVDPWTRAQVAGLGIDNAAYAKSIGVKGFHTVRGMTPAEATRLMPTLEFNGIGGGYQGKGSKTIVPAEAFVKISCRLVANQDPVRIRELVEGTIRERCSPLMQLEFLPEHDGWPYRVVPPDLPHTPADQNPHLAAAFRAADAAVERSFGAKPLYLPEGGSVPIIATLKTRLGMDSLMLGLFAPTDNLHAPNESFNLAMFRRGIDVSEAILSAVAFNRAAGA